MKLVIPNTSPADLLVEDASEAALGSLSDLLTFRDRQVMFLLQRHKKNWRLQQEDPDKWEERKRELEGQLKRCLLTNTDGYWKTYAGLASDVALAMPGVETENRVIYPPARGIAWDHVPEHEERYYQDEAKRLMVDGKHVAIELPTGAGKSRIIVELCHEFGLQAIIMSPSASIARQLYEDFIHAFGKSKVGLYGDGKKEVGKLFTIGISNSLTLVEPGTPAWDHFSKTKVFLADESHMCPADTLEKVCCSLLAAAPYRFFLSATQTRTDGAELLLKGITGPIVYRKTLQELVDQGFLAKPMWKMVRIHSQHFFHSSDVMKVQQEHLYNSPLVLNKAALIINGLARQGQRVLVLVDEMEQFARLHPLITVEARFAHGGATKANRGKLPPAFHKSDPQALVKAFDRGEFPVLIGTSCISMGTDIRSPETVVYLQGGLSSIGVPQAVGRGTRRGFLYPDGHRKTAFNFIDFCPIIDNGHYNDSASKTGGDDEESAPISPVFRHAMARARMYKKLYPNTLQWM